MDFDAKFFSSVLIFKCRNDDNTSQLVDGSFGHALTVINVGRRMRG